MARKISVKLILELRNSGLSVNQIANSRHISKHSVWGRRESDMTEQLGTAEHTSYSNRANNTIQILNQASSQRTPRSISLKGVPR